MESLLDESFREPAERAWASTWDQLDEGGLLDGVSVAVWASTSPLHYHRVPRGLMVPWGQGPLLLAAKRIAALRSRPGAATADT
jgi:unsaturated rhamnogalacturonyl hydrolase